MEILLQFLGELILQVLGEALAELWLLSLAEPLRKPPNPWLASLGYLLYGCIFGALSLVAVRHHLLPDGPARIANLIGTPVVLGLCMSMVGRWRAKRGEPVIRIERFFYGYLFALGFALVRFSFAS